MVALAVSGREKGTRAVSCKSAMQSGTGRNESGDGGLHKKIELAVDD